MLYSSLRKQISPVRITPPPKDGSMLIVHVKSAIEIDRTPDAAVHHKAAQQPCNF